MSKKVSKSKKRPKKKVNNSSEFGSKKVKTDSNSVENLGNFAINFR